MFTCTSCACTFNTFEAQKNHFRLDSHRYNLKRKVVGLPPITAEQFARRKEGVGSHPTTTESDEQHSSSSGANNSKRQHNCHACHKSFKTNASYENHLASKKHLKISAMKEALVEEKGEIETKETVVEETKDVDEPVVLPKTTGTMNEDDMDVTDVEAEDSASVEDEEKEEDFVADLKQCNFCPLLSDDMESNLSHMQTQHGFFIPDVEYLVDLNGFLTYVAEKVQLGRMCLFCNTHGKAYSSAKDVQKHMVAKSHCKLLYQPNEDLDEYSDFYDFTASYDDAGVVDDENESEFEFSALEERSITISDTGEMVLPDGRRLGTRQMRHYYKQHGPEPDTRECTMAVLRERLSLCYASAGLPSQFTSAVAHFRRNNSVLVSTGQSINEGRKSRTLREKHRGRLDFRSHKMQRCPNRKVMICV